MGVTGSLGGRGQAVAFNCQRQGGCGLPWWKNSLTLTDLWHLVVDNSVSGSEIGRKSTPLLLDLYKQHFLSQVNKTLIWIIKTESQSPLVNSQIWASLQTQNPLNEGEAGSPWGKTSVKVVYMVTLSHILHQGDWHPFARVTAIWGKENNQNFQELLDTGFELTLIPRDPTHHCSVPINVGA